MIVAQGLDFPATISYYYDNRIKGSDREPREIAMEAVKEILMYAGAVVVYLVLVFTLLPRLGHRGGG